MLEKPAFRQLPVMHHLHILTGPNGSGKTRYLSWLSEKVLAEIEEGKSEYRRIICLSGTVDDRYSPKIFNYTKVSRRPDCIYLGYRTNNNTFSLLAPFRTLFANILYERKVSAIGCSIAANFLTEFGLEPRVFLTSVHQSGKSKVRYLFDFERAVLPDVGPFDSLARFSLTFERAGKELELSELSSGQKWYLLAVLTACLCVRAESLIVIDEPENALHPEWQLRIIKRFIDALSAQSIEYTMVVSTHSPLIASSLPNRNLLICDLPSDATWQKANLHGQTADTVLNNQFGVVSARSPAVLALIQRGLRILAQGGAESAALRSVISSLREFDLSLDPHDPLHDTLETLLHLSGDRL